jgi:P pilus assembly chaperone PapD
MKTAFAATFALLLALPPLMARADGFTVSPQRVEFSAQRQVVTVQVVNTGVEPLALQASAVRWGSLPNAIAPDAAPLVFEPAIVTVAPGRRQNVRVALFDGTPPGPQRRYQLRFTPLPTHRDLPSIGPASSTTAARSVPVVVAAAGVVHPVSWGLFESRASAKPTAAERRVAKGVPPKRRVAKRALPDRRTTESLASRRDARRDVDS